ncbi:unnamed protein product [Lupinus luteus]|uniref:BZIP domain-containing protein n=1 Tax=Lupinus luteus TaxID=3873 RepID=A0AAV1Y4S7_LUPLU
MGIQTMGSQAGGGGNSNGKRLQVQPLLRQNSMYNLTLDEVQNQFGDLGKPLSSVNIDELLKNVLTVEANQSEDLDIESTPQVNQAEVQHQGSPPLTDALSKKTVDEVWRNIQQSRNNNEKKYQERQPTFGEMTLEDFLVKAGIVAEGSSNAKNTSTVSAVDSNVAIQQFHPQGQWMPYPQPQYQHPQQNLMGIYMPGQGIAQPLQMRAGASVDVVPFADNQVALPSPVTGTMSDTQTPRRKRNTPEDMVEKSAERRQKRMIKNRESAARSRARKQAYTNELENKVSRLEEENERLRKQQQLEKMLPCAPRPEPKYQLRRIASAPF